MLSDHSFVIVELGRLSVSSSTDTTTVRRWRELDIDAFTMDLLNSDLVRSPPDDVAAAFVCYDTTLRSLIDRHVPAVVQSARRCHTARWFDADCRAMKRATRRLECRCRRVHMLAALHEWREQFRQHRALYESRFTSYWVSTVESCGGDTRKLWKTINSLLEPPQQPPGLQLTADDFCDYFRQDCRHCRHIDSAVRIFIVSFSWLSCFHSSHYH
jgi:hypothetical protein